MPKPKNHELTKHTLNLRAGDFDKIGELFPDLGPSVAVRQILSRFIDKHFRPGKEVAVDPETIQL